MTHTNIILYMSIPIEISSSSGEITRDVFLQSHIYYIKIKCCNHSGIKYGGIHKQTNREDQVSH